MQKFKEKEKSFLIRKVEQEYERRHKETIDRWVSTKNARPYENILKAIEIIKDKSNNRDRVGKIKSSTISRFLSEETSTNYDPNTIDAIYIYISNGAFTRNKFITKHKEDYVDEIDFESKALSLWIYNDEPAYHEAIKQNSSKGFDKFLNEFEESIYAPEILEKRKKLKEGKEDIEDIEKLDKYKKEVEDKTHELTQIRTQYDELLKSKEELQQQIKAKQSEINALSKKNGALQKDLSKKELELKKLHDKHNKLIITHGILTNKLTTKTNEIEKLKKENDQLVPFKFKPFSLIASSLALIFLILSLYQNCFYSPNSQFSPPESIEEIHLEDLHASIKNIGKQNKGNTIPEEHKLKIVDDYTGYYDLDTTNSYIILLPYYCDPLPCAIYYKVKLGTSTLWLDSIQADTIVLRGEEVFIGEVYLNNNEIKTSKVNSRIKDITKECTKLGSIVSHFKNTVKFYEKDYFLMITRKGDNKRRYLVNLQKDKKTSDIFEDYKTKLPKLYEDTGDAILDIIRELNKLEETRCDTMEEKIAKVLSTPSMSKELCFDCQFSLTFNNARDSIHEYRKISKKRRDFN